MSINPPIGQQPQQPAFIESAASVQNQPVGADAPISIALDTQPADPNITIKPHDLDKADTPKVNKAQVAWHTFKLAGLLTVGLPFAVFGAGFYMLGWTATSIATAKTPWRFKEDMAEGIGNVLSPLLEEVQGIISELNPQGSENPNEPLKDSEASIVVTPDAGAQDFGGGIGPAGGGIGQAEEERVMREAANPVTGANALRQQQQVANPAANADQPQDSAEAREAGESREPNPVEGLPVSMPRAQSNQKAERKRQQEEEKLEQEKLEQERADQRRADQQRADIAHDQRAEEAQGPPAADQQNK